MTSAEITTLVNQRLATATASRVPKTLYAPIDYVLSLGGKRIRPTLLLLAYQMWRDDVEAALDTACGLEIYHNYTLLHDDLMDHAPLRRGHPTVHERWDANTAILSGDSMLVLAAKNIAKCPADKLAATHALFCETALEIGEGQQYDMDFERRDDVSEAEYIEMIRLKTSVLLACALKMGAVLAGAPAADADNLYRFGEQIGLAFQLQDDYLDVYGDSSVFGKTIGGDILCNKKTYMLINALRLAAPKEREELQCWIDAKDFDPRRKIAAVTAIYDHAGIAGLAQQKIAFYFAESRKYLDAVALPGDKKAALKAYAEGMMKRTF